MTKPELIRRWVLGTDGWSMPGCEVDLRVGGTYRYEWRRYRDGTRMAMGGVFREISPLERLVATEKFEELWYPGEALDTTVLVEQGGKTTMTLTVLFQVLFQSREARDSVLKSNMEQGLAASCEGLAELLATRLAGETRKAPECASGFTGRPWTSHPSPRHQLQYARADEIASWPWTLGVCVRRAALALHA